MSIGQRWRKDGMQNVKVILARCLKLLGQLNSSVFVLIILLVGAIWAAYQIGKIVNKFGGFEKERQETRDNLTSIKDNMAKINATLMALNEIYLITIKITNHSSK